MPKELSTTRLRPRVSTVFDDPSLTVQSDRDLSDIQSILRNFGAQALEANLNDADLQFMDVSEFSDYADVLREARTAELEFMKLPSKVREIFNHDAAEWLDAAHDPPKRREALSKLAKLRGGTPDVEMAQKALEGPPSPPPTDSEPSS